MRIRSFITAVIAIALTAPLAPAADWFVAPDTKDGIGSRQKPFRDPYLALRAAEPGDVIHMAAGVYYGRYDRSCWEVACPKITIRGGYNREFTQRTPWKTPSVFAVYRDYEGVRDGFIFAGKGDHSGLVLDGLAFDSAGRNEYGDKPLSSVRLINSADGAIAWFNSPGVVIRNCIFANSITGGVEISGEGSRFENNLVVNIVGQYMLVLRSSPAGNKESIVVKSNTFAFAHDTGEPPLGRGGNNAIGIRVNCPAVIEGNIFYGCGNFGIRLDGKPDRIAADRNIFWIDSFDVIGKRAGGDEADITEKNIEELEDLGLKSAKGNVASDPGLSCKPAWVDAVTRYMLIQYARPPRDAIAALRTAAALAPFNPAAPTPKPQPKADPFDSSPKPAAKVEENPAAGALAPMMEIADCAAIRVTVADRGAHAIDLPVEIAPEPPAVAAQTYEPIDWEKFVAGDASLANKHVEIRGGLASETNWFMLPDVQQDKFVGFMMLYPGIGPVEGAQVFARRFTRAQRQFEEGEKYLSARDVESTYLIRGTCRVDTGTGRQKATIVIDSILPAPLVAGPAPKRPPGHDWFVRAGATGGDGTRERPFRDPFQALDKAEGGDVIHIAGGDYFGKLRSGTWKIPVRNLTLLGGYDATFNSRDPWKNPTRLTLAEAQKGKTKHDGTFLQSEDVSDGLILDGFVFDGSATNIYLPTGALDIGASSLKVMVDLRAGPGGLTVRNCLFANAAGNAISMTTAAGTFENNIVVNTSGWSIGIQANGPGPWIVRNNTILFASDWTPNAGTGISSSAGTLLRLSGRAITSVEGNIFGFADNYAIRCTTPRRNVSLNNNAFVGNVYCHLTDTSLIWAHSANWERRVATDSDFASARGNIVTPIPLALDKSFADKTLARLFTLPPQYSIDDWKQIATATGASVIPASAAATSTTAPPKVAAPKKEPSLDDLMADLNKMKQDAPAKPASEAAGPPYAPAYDFRKALDLASDAPSTTLGARRLKLDVSFTGGAIAAAKQYTHITGAQVDAGRDQWNDKLIEIDATGARSTQSDGLFPPGFTKKDCDAYNVVLSVPGGEARTAVAIIVRKDTNASKLMDRVGERDTLLIRGTARVLPTYRGLCIVVDSVERADK